MDSLYLDTLLAYAKNTAHERGLLDATNRATDVNSLCGDAVTFEAVIRNNCVERIGHKTLGCILCRASSAWLAEQLHGQTKHEAVDFIDTQLLQINIPKSDNNIFVVAAQNPTRTKCITLPWHVARHALTNDTAVPITLLRTIYDPELPVNIYDLGLIYDISATENGLNITMTLTTPNCPVADTFPTQIQQTLSDRLGVNVKVVVTFDPPWTIERATEDARILLQR